MSDAIVVGGGWISEHYFTTTTAKESFQTRVLERRRFWDAEVAAGRETPRTRFLAQRHRLATELAADPDAAYPRVLDILGPSGAVVVRARAVDTVAEVLARDGDTLTEPVRLEDGEQLTSVARLVSEMFHRDDSPALVLILAGRWAMLAEPRRWAEGRYLAVDLRLVCERHDTTRGGEIDRALICLSAGGVWWDEVLRESIRHTAGVSRELRDGVRLSVEILANEVVRRRHARGLPPLPATEAPSLAQQSLRFLYRILFLLYVEPRSEVGGNTLDRLRELLLVDLGPRARTGRHFYESLRVLFRIADENLHADLFRDRATAHLDAVGLGNAALQEVLGHLMLTRERRGQDRGYISYAELGINQLGAVYEGLMAYTGFFADTDLHEVARGGDPARGSWVVPVEWTGDPADFVTVDGRRVVHPRGTFVFRPATRERQQSASYYTPEVLTRFTVAQALEELLDDDTPAERILAMTICEPALGSGAFAIEAVRQLAAAYLTRRQRELGRRIPPEDHPRRLQEVKAYLARHNVYGVDRNATAVELAGITLWLDTMVDGLPAPRFGLRLRRGNSLVGARRAGYDRGQVTDARRHTRHPPFPAARRGLGIGRRRRGGRGAGSRGGGSPACVAGHHAGRSHERTG